MVNSPSPLLDVPFLEMEDVQTVGESTRVSIFLVLESWCLPRSTTTTALLEQHCKCVAVSLRPIHELL